MRLLLYLLAIGLAWGLVVPLTKIAVSTGFQPYGLLFWQTVIAGAVMTVIAALRGVWLPLGRAQLRVYVVIGLLGSFLPNVATYQAIAHLPSGVTALLYSTVPMLAFPVALLLALEAFSARRLVGLAAGMAAVLLLVAPWADIPGMPSALWVGVMLLACLCYAFEGNYLARWGMAGLDPLQVMYGATLAAGLCSLPMALLMGQWIDPRAPWGAPQWAHVAGSAISVLAYAGYVWLIAQAGPIFAAQAAYLVTIFGVFLSWAILGEVPTGLILAALALMCLGLYLVQPRPALAETAPMRES